MTTTLEEPWLEGWHEGNISANGIRQHYYRTDGANDEQPSLVLLHGFTENGECWSRVTNALAPDYDVLMLDARGHGRSAGPEAGYSQALLTQDVVEAIHALALCHPIVFGYSNGAITAAQVAAAPDLVRAVIVEDPPWSETPWQPPATQLGDGEPWPGYNAWYTAWLNWHIALRTQTLDERIAASQQFLPPGALDWPPEELATHLEAQAQFNLSVLDYVPPLPRKSPWRATVEQIACPILLLTASRDRVSSVAPQEVEQITTTWRHGQHVAFPNASHFLHHELQDADFDHFIEVVRSFLRDV